MNRRTRVKLCARDYRERPARTVLTRLPWLCLLVFPVLGLAEPAREDSSGAYGAALSIDEIALELSNPVTGLRSLAIDAEYRTYQGDLPDADQQTFGQVVFTPSWPIRLRNGQTLFLRASVPLRLDPPRWNPVYYLDWSDFLLRQVPDLDPTTGSFSYGHDSLGPIGFDIALGGVNDNGRISMFGIANVTPNADDKSARRGQWLLGPEFALGKVTSWGLLGVRAKHLTNVFGEGEQEVDYDTNETTLSVFFAYALGDGWQIESTPTILYDWEAVSGNEWLVPVGLGVSKTMYIGRVPTKLAFEIQNFVVSPDRFGSEWLLKVSFTPVLSTRLMR